MHAARLFGIEATKPFEFAARTGFEALQSGVDTMLDRRVIADIEVQEADIFMGSPIPAIESTGLLHIEGPRQKFLLPGRREET